MSILTDFSDDQLRAELSRREEAKKALLNSLPKLLSVRDDGEIVRLCNAYLLSLNESKANPEYTGDPDDFKQYIFEAALEYCFGGEIWKWVNQKK